MPIRKVKAKLRSIQNQNPNHKNQSKREMLNKFCCGNLKNIFYILKLFLGHSFIGIFDDCDIHNLMIKLDTFCFLYKCENNYILVYITPLTLEIIDSYGFLSNQTCYPESFLSFLDLYSKTRILMSNPPLNESTKHQCEIYSVYTSLRQNGYHFSDIISRFF